MAAFCVRSVSLVPDHEDALLLLRRRHRGRLGAVRHDGSQALVAHVAQEQGTLQSPGTWQV